MGVIIRNGIEYSGAGMGGSCDCDEIVYLTQEEYDALPASKESNNVEYRITNANESVNAARDWAYDNSESGLEAETVQDAIDEVNGNVNTLSESLGNLLKYKEYTIQVSDSSWNESTGGWWAYASLPEGVTPQNYLFSVILGFGQTGGYCRYIGLENGRLCIVANQQPTVGQINVRVFYNGLI